MSQFLDSIKDVKQNYKRYDVWEQNQADDVAQRRYLSEKLDLPKDKVELTRAKANAVFRASDMMDKRSEDNCADMEQATGIVSLAALLPLGVANLYYMHSLSKKSKSMSTKQAMYLPYIVMALGLISGIGLALWGNAKQKEASRIGRFQAKNHELKDAKNFVLYTPEQMETAKTLAKNIPDKKTNKNLSKIFSDMKQMSKDKVEYGKWLKQRISNEEEIQKILNTEFTPEQIVQGDEDKEIIVNIIKDVNMSAETYSENVENAFDTIGLMSFITNLPISLGVNKILKNFKNISPATKLIAPFVACSLFTLPMMFWQTHEKKQGSRVGRFLKRQEILDNPELIMAYSNEQLKQAKDIKAPKLKNGFFEKLQDNFTFFGKYLKEKKAYQKYKETTAKEKEKIYEALQQTEISEKQLKKAKNLQEKTFRTFDKIDEMSQRYSEDTEAATQIAMQLISTISSFIGLAIPGVIGWAVLKGKFPLKGLIKTASKIALKEDSSIRTFVNKSFEIINKDKELKKDFSKILIDKKIQAKFINHPKLQELYMELKSHNEKYFAQINKITDIKDTKEAIENIAKELLNEHGRQNPVSKWIKNISEDIFKLKNKVAEKSFEKIDPFKEIAKFYNDYKTLSKTILLGGFVPILGVVGVIPAVIASWMTNIQLKAGRIGVMKAMDEIDNPKLFVNNDSEPVDNNSTSKV